MLTYCVVVHLELHIILTELKIVTLIFFILLNVCTNFGYCMFFSFFLHLESIWDRRMDIEMNILWPFCSAAC